LGGEKLISLNRGQKDLKRPEGIEFHILHLNKMLALKAGWSTMPTGAIPTPKNNNPDKNTDNNIDCNNPYFNHNSNNPDFNPDSNNPDDSKESGLLE
jgi:hypothetical protein